MCTEIYHEGFKTQTKVLYTMTTFLQCFHFSRGFRLLFCDDDASSK